jgi:hypothetical protein
MALWSALFNPAPWYGILEYMGVAEEMYLRRIRERCSTVKLEPSERERLDTYLAGLESAVRGGIIGLDVVVDTLTTLEDTEPASLEERVRLILPPVSAAPAP